MTQQKIAHIALVVKDYDEAIALCKDYPDYESGGTIQVRQVMKIDM